MRLPDLLVGCGMVFELSSSSTSSSSSVKVASCNNGGSNESSAVLAENVFARASLDRKNHAVKPAPKKAHKAEREKLKRDHLNELFYELGNALETSRQNNGKASILGDATKLLQDLIAQVETLRKEHTALLNESRYVSQEKNELKDETLVLGEEIQKLQEQIQERMQQSTSPSVGSLTSNSLITQAAATPLPMQRPHVAAPGYAVPVLHDQQCIEQLHEPAPSYSVQHTIAHVSRPHARYPSLADSWTFQVLPRPPRAGDDDSGSMSASSNGEQRSPPRELNLLN